MKFFVGSLWRISAEYADGSDSQANAIKRWMSWKSGFILRDAIKSTPSSCFHLTNGSSRRHQVPDLFALCEGYVRLCGHEHISHTQIEEWIETYQGKNNRPEDEEIVLECLRCFADMKPSGLPLSVFEGGTYQPRVVISGSHLWWAQLDIEKIWEVPMVRLTESTGEVATEEMVSTALEEIQRNYGDLTCPHVRFTDGRLSKASTHGSFARSFTEVVFNWIRNQSCGRNGRKWCWWYASAEKAPI